MRCNFAQLAAVLSCSFGAEAGKLTYGNLNNQKIGFYAAIIASKQFNATLVMPQWSTPEFVPFTHLWDADHFLRSADAAGIPVLIPSALESMSACSPEDVRDSLVARQQLFESGTTSTLCVKSSEAFYDLWKYNLHLTEEEMVNEGALLMHAIVAKNAHFADARKWLVPSRYLARRAHHIVNELTGGEPFYSVHVRTEGDFVHACKVWDARIDSLQCFLTVGEIAEELEQRIPHGSLLYVFPPQSPEALHELCNNRYKCIHRDSIDPALELAYNERALLDSAVVGHAAGAYGNIYSTMSVEVVASAWADGKPGAFLNTPCPEQHLGDSQPSANASKCP